MSKLPSAAGDAAMRPGAPGWARGWLDGRRRRAWLDVAAAVLLGFVLLVHVDLVLRTLRSQLPLSAALMLNAVVFAVAIAMVALRAGELGWLLGVAGALGAATAWLSTELFPALSMLDPEGRPWPGNGLGHLLTVHLSGTGNATFLAEIAFVLLWARTTTWSPASTVTARRARWAVAAVAVVLLAGFVVVLLLGGGAGERYGTG